jgi:hypothetical protein
MTQKISRNFENTDQLCTAKVDLTLHLETDGNTKAFLSFYVKLANLFLKAHYNFLKLASSKACIESFPNSSKYLLN